MHSNVKSNPSPEVTSAIAAGISSGVTPCVAPKAFALSNFPSWRSTATIADAPAILAPCIAAIPTPPAPTTRTDDPGVTFAVFSAAPTPVVTPQPISAAISRGMSLSIFTVAIAGTIVSSAKVPHPQKDPMTLSPCLNCWFTPIAINPFMHKFG